jgi:3-oxoacyl-[acyl-carrier-protein] synthase II
LIESTHDDYLKGGPRKISPFFVPGTIINMIAGLLSIEIGAKGPNLAMVTACTTSTHCIGEASKSIRYGDADVMIAGGSEAVVTELAIGGFASARALSTRNDDPATASRPWDKERDGFVLGEGAGAMVLEEYEHAKARGAPILAELLGYGMTADAADMVNPSIDGASTAMQMALDDAGLGASDIDYINAHGTATAVNDINETRAIKRVFGNAASKLSISSTKSMHGHCLGAGGGIEAVAAVKAIGEGFVPPTMGLDEPDPECDLDYTPNKGREREVNYAMSNSFAFGGLNAVLVFGPAPA